MSIPWEDRERAAETVDHRSGDLACHLLVLESGLCRWQKNGSVELITVIEFEKNDINNLINVNVSQIISLLSLSS